MEDLREKLNEYSVKYRTNDERTLEISRKLDPYMAREQAEYGSNKYV